MLSGSLTITKYLDLIPTYKIYTVNVQSDTTWGFGIVEGLLEDFERPWLNVGVGVSTVGRWFFLDGGLARFGHVVWQLSINVITLSQINHISEKNPNIIKIHKHLIYTKLRVLTQLTLNVIFTSERQNLVHSRPLWFPFWRLGGWDTVLECSLSL